MASNTVVTCCRRTGNLESTKNRYTYDGVIYYEVLICRECKRYHVQVNNGLKEVEFKNGRWVIVDNSRDRQITERVEFVNKLGELLHIAKPNLFSCHLATGRQIMDAHTSEPHFKTLHPDLWEFSEYVVVTCENEYQYLINVSANSLAAIAEAVFKQMVCK